MYTCSSSQRARGATREATATADPEVLPARPQYTVRTLQMHTAYMHLFNFTCADAYQMIVTADQMLNCMLKCLKLQDEHLHVDAYQVASDAHH